MPINAKGRKIMRKMKEEYGSKGEQVFYATLNKGKITGVEGGQSGRKKKRKR